MSSTGQPASSSSTIQLIIDEALSDYARITGIDLTGNPIAAALEQSNTPEAILQLLQGREKEFKEYRDGDRRLISCLDPAVKVLQAFSGIMGEAASLIPFPPTNVLFAGIDTLLAAATGVTSSYDALLDLFECLGNFLKRLEIYTTIPPTPIMTDIIIKIMIELLSVLALATKQIKQGRFKKFAKKLLGDSEIETVLQRLDRLTQDEARMTAAQTLGVVHGLVGNMKVVMEDGKASTDSIRQDLVALHQVLSEINKMKRDQLRQDVERWLSPPDPSTNQKFVAKARQKGSGAWFFESDTLTEWKSRGSLLWIHGKPGAGKSTLLSAIVQDVEHMHVAGFATLAYYYFDFRDFKKQDCYGLLSSLISQLSAKSDSCFNILSELYSEISRGVQKPDIDALKICLTDMLNLPGQAPIYIIVDALDECPNFPGRPSAREEVLDLIEELAGLNLSNVHLCVASRPEIDIRMVLESLTALKISLHDESGQKEDIIAYIKSVVRLDRRMRRWKDEDRELVIDTLSEKADGMFRWVVCQVDGLSRTFPASIRKVLNDLPKTLDETYERTLLGIDVVKREYAQRLFRCLTASIRPLRVEELAEILAVQFDEASLPTFNAAWRPENAEEAVMSACSSLVTIVDRAGEQVVQFSHYSVKEFLTSERLATAEERLLYYHILPETAHTTLAHACLCVLLQLDDKIDRNAICHFPLALYAARYWVEHAQLRNVSSHLQEAMARLFDSSKPHFSAWVWLHDIDHDWIEPMSMMHPTQPEAVPLYYASLCGFGGLVEHLIAVNPKDINNRGGRHTTPLHAASFERHLEAASLLLRNGADPNSRDLLEKTPLYKASRAGQFVGSSLEIARLLVNSGADVNFTDDGDWTPLHAAAQYGRHDIAELLVTSGARLNIGDKDGDTPLHEATWEGRLEVTRFLLDRGSDMDFRNKNGLIPLHLASRYGHLDVVRLLLDRGSDMNVRVARHKCHDDASDREPDLGAGGQTPMHFASAYGHLDIAKLLVERGANVDLQNDNQETPLNHAAGSGLLDITRFLIESGAVVVTRNDQGWTPFHKASYAGHLHIAKFLLEYGNDVDIRSGNEETALHLASGGGKLDVACFLIEHGADIHAKDDKGSNPLHIASQNGHLDVVQMLINSGIAADILNGTQRTPLTLASSNGKVEVGLFLIEQEADINVRDNEGYASLHLASEHGHLDMVQLLLDHGADANVQRGDLWSPLHLASSNGHLKIAELLVQSGASIGVFNEKQETPLFRAVWSGKVSIAQLLIDHGANLHSVDSNGSTLLHTASERGHLEVVKLLLRFGADVKAYNKADLNAAELALMNDKVEVAKFIIQYKTDANIRNKILSTTSDVVQYGADEDGEECSLHSAAEEGNINVVKLLLERGIDVNSHNADNQTPLDRAARWGKLDVVRLLIEWGAEVDTLDAWGWTPLHKASRYGHLGIVKLLLKHGADVDAPNVLGWTPLHLASRNGHLEVSRVLLDHGANVNKRNQEHNTPIQLSAGYGRHLGIVKLLLDRGADVHTLNDDGETPYQLSLRNGHRDIADLLLKHDACRVSP